MTIVYLIRHSKALKKVVYDSDTTLQTQNEEWILSCEGEKIALEFSKKKFLEDIDVVISSNYIRAISTAKYIAENNNKEVIVIKDFGERKFGVSSWDELPSDFYKKQFLEEDFKVGNGESRKEVTNRMVNALNDVLNSYKNKKIVIVSHATAITFLLMSFGTFSDEKLIISKKKVFDKDFIWNNLDTIQLVFNDDCELLDFKVIKNDIM